MQININIPDTDLDGVSIKDLIIADIHLGLICEKLENYDYDMNWLKERKELVKDELEKKIKAQYRRKLAKLEARFEADQPTDIKLKKMSEEILTLKKKLGQ